MSAPVIARRAPVRCAQGMVCAEAIPSVVGWRLLPFDKLRTGVAPLLHKKQTSMGEGLRPSPPAFGRRPRRSKVGFLHNEWRGRDMEQLAMTLGLRSDIVELFHLWLTLAQSARKRSTPTSVRGCLRAFIRTSWGTVATSAPRRAASTTCMGWRMLAAMI